ncbi:hypothetical protein FRC19_009112, partial [Serendipita sp. 401]
MPRPRSSTFYLPLAPVDAPLSLKAKLSVLPPSAANALLAPRTTAHQPPPPLPPTCNPSYLQESSPSAPVVTSSLSGSGGPVAGEDECARLERVLGLSSHVGSRRTTRRHTDAPLPLMRTDFTTGRQRPSPPASSLSSPSQPPLLEVPTSLPPGTPPTPALSCSSSTDSCDSSSSETMELEMDASFVVDQATCLDRATDRFSNDAGRTVHLAIDKAAADAPVYRRLSASAPLTQMMVTVEQLSTEHSGLQEAETSTTPSAPGLTNAGGRNLGTELYSDASASAQLTRIEVDKAQDRSYRAAGLPLPRSKATAIVEEVMRPPTLSNLPCGFSKVWACRPPLPSRLSSSITPNDDSNSAPPVFTSHSTSSTRPLPTLYNFPSSGSLHVSDARHLLPRQFRMPYPPPPPPCALPSAVDSTPYISNFIPSPVNNIPTTLEASTFTDSGITLSASTTSASSSHPVAASINDVASLEKSHLDMDDEDEDLEIDPDEELDNDSSAVSIPCITHSAEVMGEEDVPRVAIALTPPSTPQPPCNSTSHSSQSSLYPQQHSSYPHFTQGIRPIPPPRQRFRLAPVYLNKLLRRSLGQTAWAREEALRIARSVEKRYGCALVSKAMGGHCREADRWEDFADYSSAQSGGYYGSTSMRKSSLVWSGYEEVQENGDGDVFAANGDYSGVISNDQVMSSSSRRFVEGEWVEEVFSNGSYVGWDLDLENDCAEFEADGEGEDDADVQMETELEMGRQDEQGNISLRMGAFVREGAPEPEDRRLLFRPSDEHGLLRVQEDEDTRSPSPDGYGGYAMVGKFTWNSDWPSSPVSPLHESASSSSTYRDPPATPYHPVLSAPSSDLAYTSSSLLPPFSRSDQGEEENPFRYSPLQLPQEDSVVVHEHDDQFHYSPLDEDHPHGHMDVDRPGSFPDRPFLSATAFSSTDSIPLSLSPSFPPGPLLGTKISSEDGLSESGTITDEEEDERFYESDGDAPMADGNDKRKPEVGQDISYVPAQVDLASSPAAGVFIIPPSPLGTFSFDTTPPRVVNYNRGSPDVPSSPISPSWTYVTSSPIHHHLPHQPAYPPPLPPSQHVLPSNAAPASPEHTPRRSIERFRLARSSMERIRPARRSMEWIKPMASSVIPTSAAASSPSSTHPYEFREVNGGPVLVAPRPRRASRALEGVFSRQSPVLKTSSLPPVSSPPLIHSHLDSSSTLTGLFNDTSASPPPRPAP